MSLVDPLPVPLMLADLTCIGLDGGEGGVCSTVTSILVVLTTVTPMLDWDKLPATWPLGMRESSLSLPEDGLEPMSEAVALMVVDMPMRVDLDMSLWSS